MIKITTSLLSLGLLLAGASVYAGGDAMKKQA